MENMVPLFSFEEARGSKGNINNNNCKNNNDIVRKAFSKECVQLICYYYWKFNVLKQETILS